MSIINNLPNGWAITALGDICKLKNGYAFKSDSYKKDGTPVIRISDIGDGKVDLTSCVKVEIKELFLDYQVKVGDILVAMSGATTGKFGIYNGKELAFQNQRVGRFEVLNDSLLNNNFLLYLLYRLKQRILDDAYGGAQPNISSGKIEQMEVPLPPLAEQHRIVAKIEELFTDLDKGIETLKTAKDQLKVYRQAVLKYAFEGRLTNSDVKEGTLPIGWEVKAFGNCTINLDGKRVPLSREVRAKRKGNFRYYGATEIVDYIDDFIFEGRFLLIGEDGANLLSKSKPLSHIAEGQFWVNNHAHIVQAVEGIKLDYLCHFINAMFLDEYVTGTAQPKLTQSNMNKIPVAIPISLKEQEEIIQEIESRLSICDKIEESIEQGLHQAEALRQSILKKAFEGKLVPQHPNDEPAHVLLARIKAERAAAQPIKKQKKAKA